MWCIKIIDAEYQRKMLDVLEVYERPYNPDQPVVCLDEKSKQLLEDVRPDIPMKSGRPRRADYEYVRRGTVNIFVAIEPKGKKRKVSVTKHRKASDFAHCVDRLVNVTYKHATKVILITDNLNTHCEKSFITTFGDAKAAQILSRIEWHYTPKHASWLDQAEVEISALSSQSLDTHIPTFQQMQRQCAAWQHDRNKKKKGITWTFTQQKARQKFKLDIKED